jgi:hypothetical protein
MRKINFSEGYSILKALYGSDIDNYIVNFGPEAKIIRQTNKEIPRNGINISIAASAGDVGDVKEHLSQFEPKSRDFGKALATNIKNESIDAVVSTGGCPNTGDWAIEELKKYNPDAYLVALLPREDAKFINQNYVASHLKKYDMIVYPDMDILFRSVIVGRSGPIIFCVHGGFGSAIEASTAAEVGNTIAFYNVDSIFGVSKYGIDFFKGISYKDTGAVFFRNSDPSALTLRAFVEHEIKRKNLGDKLTAVVVYEHLGRRGKNVFVNIRETKKPRTFYHRGGGVTPIDQTLIVAPKSKVIELFNSLNGEAPTILARREMEVDHMLEMPPNYDVEESLKLAEILRQKIESRGIGEVFFNRSF